MELHSAANGSRHLCLETLSGLRPASDVVVFEEHSSRSLTVLWDAGNEKDAVGLLERPF